MNSLRPLFLRLNKAVLALVLGLMPILAIAAAQETPSTIHTNRRVAYVQPPENWTLEAYAIFTRKTIFAPASLPKIATEMIPNLPSETNAAIAAIEKELSKRGIAIVQDGPRFARVFPENQRGFISSIPLRGAMLASSNYVASLPPGSINIIGISPDDALDIFPI